nr:hypothetical protein [uncultured Lichenicoccus sp.]
MQILELAPAALIALAVLAGAVGRELLPAGEATVLVRVAPGLREAPLLAAAGTGAALVAIPAPGFAVLHGNAARIRSVLGLAVVWPGNAPCSSSS